MDRVIASCSQLDFTSDDVRSVRSVLGMEEVLSSLLEARYTATQEIS